MKFELRCPKCQGLLSVAAPDSGELYCRKCRHTLENSMIKAIYDTGVRAGQSEKVAEIKYALRIEQ